MNQKQFDINYNGASFLVQVLNGPKRLKEARVYAIESLQKAVDYAKTNNQIDPVLVKRAMTNHSNIEELEQFVQSTEKLRGELVLAIKDAATEVFDSPGRK